MTLTIFIFLSIIVSIVIIRFQHNNAVNKALNKSNTVLYCSNNRNSYESARDVFKTLKEAGIEPNFIGNSNEE